MAIHLLTTPESASVIKYHPGSLKNLRCWNQGPEYERRGDRVYYELGTLLAWASTRPRASGTVGPPPTPRP